MSRTRNSRAVVTGAGSGIGRAIAIELHRRGGHVICSDIDEAAAARTAKTITEAGGYAWPTVSDVSKIDDVRALADYAQATLDGGVSLVVNNAGIGAGGKYIGELGIAEWERCIGIDLWGPIYGCEVFVPLLRQRGDGGVINVSSAASYGAAPLMGPYNVAKAGVLTLSETLRAELAGSGVCVSALCPTLVKTNIAASVTEAPGSAMDSFEKLMSAIGYSPERIARITLNAHDRGELYIFPQIDAKLGWSMKRHLPRTYTFGLGAINRVASKYFT